MCACCHESACQPAVPSPLTCALCAVPLVILAGVRQPAQVNGDPGTTAHKAIERAKTYLSGTDKDVLCGFFVSSINEWKVHQPRYLLLSKTAYYRVTYSHKTGKIDHYQDFHLSKLRVIEKTARGLKIYLTEQYGRGRAGK